MDHAATLRGICEEYLLQVDQLLRNAKPGDGLLGMGKAPQHDPCHDAFDQQVETCVTAAIGEGLSPAEASQLATVLLLFEREREAPPCASWMLIAIHRHGLRLVPLLSSQGAAELYQQYRKAYPIHRRLPVQRELLKALRQQADQKEA